MTNPTENDNITVVKNYTGECIIKLLAILRRLGCISREAGLKISDILDNEFKRNKKGRF